MKRHRISSLMATSLTLLLLFFCVQGVHAEGPMALSSYPRPSGDNGRGIHWSPTLFAQPPEMIDRLLAEVEAMDMKWVKIIQGDAPKLEHEVLIERLTERGIMPVLRIYKPRNEPYQYLTEIVQAGVAKGVYYYELYNEPNVRGQAGGWPEGSEISVERMVDLWVAAADEVIAAGGLPGLPPLAPGGHYDDVQFLRDFLRALKKRGRVDVLYRSWVALHNYFLNHPVDYPYDEVNLRSVPLTADEGASRGLSAAEVDAINHARRISRLPRSQGGYYVGDTVYEDSNCFLKFQAYARILEEECGFIIPIITTEGGAIIGSQEDPRYPPVTEDDLVRTTLAAFDYVAEQAPPYYFAFMPWLLANRAGNSLEKAWEGAAWIKEDWSTLPVVDALKRRSSTPIATQSSSGAQPETHTTDGVRVEIMRTTLRVPDLASLPASSTPSDPFYPKAALPPGMNVSFESKEYDVLILANESTEIWLVPELGGRIIYWRDHESEVDLIPQTDSLTIARHQSGTYQVEGGLSWSYPSPTMSLVDDLEWQADTAFGAQSATASLSCTEPRSHTVLSVELTLDESELHLLVTATNPNETQRAVGFGLADSLGTVPLQVTQPNQVILAPGGSYQWSATWKQDSRSPIGQQPNQSPGRPVALVTPIPAPDSAHRVATPPSTPQSIPQVATPRPPAPPTAPSEPTAEPPQQEDVVPLSWDQRLSELGVTLNSNSGAQWRLVDARYEDETQSGGRHHIVVYLVDKNGQPSRPAGDGPWVAWQDGRTTLEIKDESGRIFGNFPMYAMLGSYSVGVGNSSDIVTGLGLPGKHHVSFVFTFQRQY